MLDFKLVNNYSGTLLELYKTNKEVSEESIKLYSDLKNNITLLNNIYNRSCPKTDKIRTLFDSCALKYTRKFFELVIKNNRSEYLLPIIKSFCKKYEEYEHIGRVKLYVAGEISKENKEKIITLMKNKFGFLQVYLDVIIDKSLIGGFVAYVNDNKYDCSIKNSLNKLSKKFNTNM
jgi:F-type H+-transporting ATPase subunit delta